ncbi:MAG: hypothetical protein M3121_04730 [Chloroflexota bacterium]|nr:hypothetical protein [Chloroflexota bacterium]
MSTFLPFVPLHTSPLDSHFHWEYQVLVLVILAGLWLFLAGRAERRRPGTDRRLRQGRPANHAAVVPPDLD